MTGEPRFFVPAGVLVEAQRGRDATGRRRDLVQLLTYDGDYITVLATGHRAESDYERETREYDERTQVRDVFRLCRVREDGTYEPIGRPVA